MKVISALLALCLMVANVPLCQAQASDTIQVPLSDSSLIVMKTDSLTPVIQSLDSLSITAKTDSLKTVKSQLDSLAASRKKAEQAAIFRAEHKKTVILVCCVLGAVTLGYVLVRLFAKPDVDLDGVGDISGPWY